jgi:hypothetical protein
MVTIEEISAVARSKWPDVKPRNISAAIGRLCSEDRLLVRKATGVYEVVR